MSDNLPAVPTAAITTATDTDSWIPVLGSIAELANRIAGTEFVPAALRDSVPATAAAILYGREVGLPPMTALTQIHVIDGRPSLSAEGMRALVLAAGHDLAVDETTGAVCTMRARRHGSDRWTPVTWTLDMAKAAGLLGKKNWQRSPRQMLQARCTTELVRLVFPDVIHGFRAVEEMDDLGAETGDTAPPTKASGGTSKVSRTRKTTSMRGTKGSPPPTEAAPARAAIQGPPLPGEAGFEDLAGGKPVGAAAPAEEKVEGGESNETSDGDGTAPQVGNTEGPPPSTNEPVEAEVVEDPPDDEPAESKAGPRKASRAQHRMILAQLADIGVSNDDREERLHIVGVLAGRGGPVESMNALTVNDAKAVIDSLGRVGDKAELTALLDQFAASGGEGS